jgi:hypothetical protein
VQTGIDGSLEELYVSAWFADRTEANAAGLVTADGGAWQGHLDLQIADEPAGTVPPRPL